MTGLRTGAVVALLIPLCGCGTVGLFGEYDLPENPEIGQAEWPRLVDVPEAPPRGQYSADAPDPAVGTALLSDLGSVAADAKTRAEQFADPVLSDADRRQLGKQ
ncbi:MAG: hypothetical protein AAGE80_13995 [Pseudomonadota bacterium]